MIRASSLSWSKQNIERNLIQQHRNNTLIMTQESQIDRLLQEIKEQRRRRLEIEEKVQKIEEKRQKIKERFQKIEEKRQKIEERFRNTTLFEFLDVCHIHLHCNLKMQTNMKMSIKSDSVNANRKVRSEKLIEWIDFSESQTIIWKNIQRSNFMHERHFFSQNILKDIERSFDERKMSFEQDLHVFERSTVENHITDIIKKLYDCSSLRDKFCLKSSMKFENHVNTLNAKEQMKNSINYLSISSTETDFKATKITSSRADQICVYNIFDNAKKARYRVAIFIVEYKTSHKLQLDYIYEDMREMNLQNVIRRRANIDDSKNLFRRLFVVVISQVFFYMIHVEVWYDRHKEISYEC